jgi:hypothetical protein
VFVLVILGTFLLLFLILGVGTELRDRKHKRGARESESMWRDGAREQARDMRASHAVHNIYNPDLSTTDWGRRNPRK